MPRTALGSDGASCSGRVSAQGPESWRAPSARARGPGSTHRVTPGTLHELGLPPSSNTDQAEKGNLGCWGDVVKQRPSWALGPTPTAFLEDTQHHTPCCLSVWGPPGTPSPCWPPRRSDTITCTHDGVVLSACHTETLWDWGPRRRNPPDPNLTRPAPASAGGKTSVSRCVRTVWDRPLPGADGPGAQGVGPRFPI